MEFGVFEDEEGMVSDTGVGGWGMRKGCWRVSWCEEEEQSVENETPRWLQRFLNT